MGLLDTRNGVNKIKNNPEPSNSSLDYSRATFDDVKKKFSNDISLIPFLSTLKSLKKSLNNKNNVNVQNNLSMLMNSSSNKDVIKYLDKLQAISLEYTDRKQFTVDNSKTVLGAIISAVSLSKKIDQDVKESKEIKDYNKFLRSLLDSNKSYLDGGITKVEFLVKDAKSLTDKELLEKINGVWLPFDIEPEEWDKYFEEHNIPKEKQNQLKKYFADLMENQDLGNLLHSDLGGDIDLEAERIVGLKEGEEIILSIDELNPSSGSLKFETKKDALIYLYYNKILFREVATFMEDILIGASNAMDIAGDIAGVIAENPSLFIYGFMSYMALNVSFTGLRKVNVYVVNKSSGRFGFGQYLNESLSATDGDTSKEAAELNKRREYIKMLEKRFKGNPEKLEEIKNVKKIIFVLDHNIDASKSQEEKISVLEKEISVKKEELEGVPKTEKIKKVRLKKEISRLRREKNKLSRDLFRFLEGTFWREVSYIEGITKFKNRYVDTLLKTFLMNTEGDSISNLDDFKKLLGNVQKDLFDSEGNKIGILEQANNFIKRSHNIPNNLEGEIEKIFNEYVKKIKNGELGNLKGSNKKELLKSIKLDIIDTINEKTGVNLDISIFKEGEGLEDAKKLFFEGYSDFQPERGALKKEVWVEKIFEGKNLSDSIISEISKFFAEIQKGSNEYNQRTALDIVARIIKKELPYKNAISESFLTDWAQVKNINIDSSFIGSLENLIIHIEEGKYSLSPKEDMIKVLDEISDRLRLEGYETDILDDEYLRLQNGDNEVSDLLKNGDIDTIFDKIETRLTPKITSLSGSIDVTLPRTVFDAIKKNGFKVTR